ncbi:hypothetical protein MXD81_53785 [Microbacteriaceae bacterium K1510]|nr:hypothetical protein [Microbacteriaceae bacterium K1510]
MSEKPLLVRVVTAGDWMEAFRLAWTTTFGQIAADHAPPMQYLKWSARRSLCLAYAARCAEDSGNSDLVGAWSALGAEPTGLGRRSSDSDNAYADVFAALARSIVADPALLDDEAFAVAVHGWHLLKRAGADGENDLIVAARLYGGTTKIDRSKLLTWARAWSQAKP